MIRTFSSWSAPGVLLAALCLVQTSPALATDAPDLQHAADAHVEGITNVQKYRADAHKVVEFALAGKHGKVSQQDARDLSASEETIDTLLDGKTPVADLTADQRLDLYTARETITRIASTSNGEQLICKNVQIAGTRLKTRQCMTKSQSDELTRSAREATATKQREPCYAGGEGSNCR